MSDPTIHDCPTCHMQPGDLIRADEDREWKHAVCPDAPPEREHPVYPKSTDQEA